MTKNKKQTKSTKKSRGPYINWKTPENQLILKNAAVEYNSIQDSSNGAQIKSLEEFAREKKIPATTLGPYCKRDPLERKAFEFVGQSKLIDDEFFFPFCEQVIVNYPSLDPSPIVDCLMTTFDLD